MHGKSLPFYHAAIMITYDHQSNAKHLEGSKNQNQYSGLRPFATTQSLQIVLGCQSIGAQKRESVFVPSQLLVHYNQTYALMTLTIHSGYERLKSPAGRYRYSQMFEWWPKNRPSHPSSI